MQFKIGDRVRCPTGVGSTLRYSNKEGIIINTQNGMCLVEFDDYISGHDGNFVGVIKGKEGHCWWCLNSEVIFIGRKEKITKVYGIVNFCKVNYR